MTQRRRIKHTVIRVAGERWLVPRGLGREYVRHAGLDASDADHSILVDLLALIGYSATCEQIASWDLRRRVEASVYASNVHARASDNPLQAHPRLRWLPDRAWQGPEVGQGNFRSPGGTVIP